MKEHSKLEAACQLAAESMGITIEAFQRLVYDQKQEEYDREDVKAWLDSQEYKYTEQDVDRLSSEYRDSYDAEFGVWDNIVNTYYRLEMDLPTYEEAYAATHRTCSKCGSVIDVDSTDFERGSAICPCCGALIEVQEGE